ncbi:MAG: hypothetical protein JWQ40_3132 [Segetibacter sp.]|nr:hypothetical protein [Segetibacter sp.]
MQFVLVNFIDEHLAKHNRLLYQDRREVEG